MKLYGLNGSKGLVVNPARPRTMAESGLSPKRRENGPPVGGYHLWMQARDRGDLMFDGDLVVGWRDRGASQFVGVGEGLTSYIEGKGVSTTSTSVFNGGAFKVAKALDRIQHFFVAVGGWGSNYCAVIGHPGDQNYHLLQANDPNRFFTSWAGGSGIRINGRFTNEMVENSNAIISNSTTNPDANTLGGDTLQIGRDRTASERRTYYSGIGDVLLYKRVLSDSERDLTEKWLAARWGILSKFQ